MRKTAITPENTFKRYLMENHPFVARRIQRHRGENPTHLRFRPGCGIDSVEELLNIFDRLGIGYVQADRLYSRSPDYVGHGYTVTHNDDSIGILVAIQKQGRVKRKSLAPKRLGFEGRRYDNVTVFARDIQESIRGQDHERFLNDLIDSVLTGSRVDTRAILREDLSRITSDFGELLAALNGVRMGKTIEFPTHSNNTVADYTANGRPVSVKNRLGGGKVNLSNFANLIDTTERTGTFLYAIATYDRDSVLRLGLDMNEQLRSIRDIFDNRTLDDYVNTHTYDEFYTRLRSITTLGIPAERDDSRARELWKQGSLEPLHFTLLTVISRLWGQTPEGIDAVSPVVTAFLDRPLFVKVDIVDDRVVFTATRFSEVKRWRTIYWSRATKAWHNWPAVEPSDGL